MTNLLNGSLLETLGFRVASLRSREISEEDRHKAKAHLLDTAGLMWAARDSAEVGQARRLVRLIGCRPLGPPDLALIGGVAAETLGLDDFDDATRLHPGAVIVPALLAAGSRGGSGRALLQALIAGYETACWLGEQLSSETMQERGFHPTAVIGTLASAAAVSYLLGLDDNAIADAVGMAASLAGGTFELDGKGVVKGLQTGMASRHGILSVFCAQAGYRPATDVLDGKRGVLRAFGATRASQKAPPECTLVDPGLSLRLQRVSFKPYLHFSDLHPATAALLCMVKQQGLSSEEVETIEVRLPTSSAPKLQEGFPPASLRLAKRCPKFSLATFLYHPAESAFDPGVECFTEETLVNPSILSLASRVSWRCDLEPSSHLLAALKLAQRNGRCIATSATEYPGWPKSGDALGTGGDRKADPGNQPGLRRAIGNRGHGRRSPAAGGRC